MRRLDGIVWCWPGKGGVMSSCSTRLFYGCFLCCTGPVIQPGSQLPIPAALSPATPAAVGSDDTNRAGIEQTGAASAGVTHRRQHVQRALPRCTRTATLHTAGAGTVTRSTDGGSVCRIPAMRVHAASWHSRGEPDTARGHEAPGGKERKKERWCVVVICVQYGGGGGGAEGGVTLISVGRKART